jgi:hypothetical protein
MNKPYFIELTNKLYRLTFLFPAKEPLRNKIREVGDDILANLVVILEGEIGKRKESAFCVEKEIEILDTLLELSKLQNWADSEEIKKIQEKYREIKTEVEEFNDILRRKTAFYEQSALLIESEERKNRGKQEDGEKREEETPVEQTQPKREYPKKEKTTSFDLNDRQKKILELLNKQEKMQVKDFQKFLPSVTKRTLRRDFSFLTEKKAVKRIGSGNMTYYSLKG